MTRRIVVLVSFLVLAFSLFAEQSECCKEKVLPIGDGAYVKVNYEKGFIWIAKHTIQFSQTGTKFDYVKEGNQSVLLPFERYTAELAIGRRHNIVFLYQPLDINTTARLERDINVNNVVFPEGTVMELKYGFSFYRMSYLYNIVNTEKRTISAGASFQIRNASIVFASKDGALQDVNQNIGPVPILKMRYRESFTDKVWTEIEADGFYASGKYITGSTNDFTGAIYDVSGRLGMKISRNIDAYMNARYIGGGANGTDRNYTGTGDGYTDNWIHTFSLSLGFSLM